ncbi:hypothetical protein EV424DRAFT_1326941, partial [Suillus variegatus]
GISEWQGWVLGEEEVIIHIKASCVFTIDIEVMTWASIYTFDTADTYSNGLSDVVLGNVIKKLSLPRDEIVVMTKVYRVVGRTPSEKLSKPGVRPDELGYVNQRGLSRKVRMLAPVDLLHYLIRHR